MTVLLLVRCVAALGRMSVACGSASMVLPAVDSSTETTTLEWPSTTNTSDADQSSVDIAASDGDDEGFLHRDQFDKIAPDG